MSKIVIDRPPSPLPPLARTARKWVLKAEWAKRAAERAPETSGSETEAIHASPKAFNRFIRRMLFWKEVQ